MRLTGSLTRVRFPAEPPGGVPDTDPDPREACRIREKQTETRVRAPSPHRATRAASIRKPYADPSGRVGGNASKKSAN